MYVYKKGKLRREIPIGRMGENWAQLADWSLFFGLIIHLHFSFAQLNVRVCVC